jgi:hypothetical protein
MRHTILFLFALVFAPSAFAQDNPLRLGAIAPEPVAVHAAMSLSAGFDRHDRRAVGKALLRGRAVGGDRLAPERTVDLHLGRDSAFLSDHAANLGLPAGYRTGSPRDGLIFLAVVGGVALTVMMVAAVNGLRGGILGPGSF